MKSIAVPSLFILMLGLFLTPSLGQAQTSNLKVNTDIFPAPENGFKKMVIEVPLSQNDENKKIEFKVGRLMEVDGCNHHNLQGTVETKDLEGWGYQYYVFKTNGQVIATQMACPDTQKRQLFVSSQPNLVRYNGKMPIVIYIPEEYDVQYKIYTADNDVYHALEAKSSKD